MEFKATQRRDHQNSGNTYEKRRSKIEKKSVQDQAVQHIGPTQGHFPTYARGNKEKQSALNGFILGKEEQNTSGCADTGRYKDLPTHDAIRLIIWTMLLTKCERLHSYVKPLKKTDDA